MIAFRTGNDPEMIDKVFRASALMRDKWNRDDYREATIEKGVKACGGTFYKTKMPHPYFIRFNEETGQPYIVVPLLAKYTREHLDYILVRDSGKQGLLKYVYRDGVYQLYSSDMMMGVIKQYIADYDEELVNMSKVSQALQHITTDLNYIGQDELNANENLINYQNGLLRVTDTDLTLIPHTPNVYSTIQIPCRWTGKPSPTPVFDSYMNTLTDGDKAVYRLLLEFIGACISNIRGWRLKKALFLVGDGDTGKSQLKSLVERLLGKGNFVGIDLKEIEARFGTGVIYGTRLAGSSDMSFLSVDELKTFKKLTGGDSVFAELKGMQGFEYTYSGLLWFCMNRLPKFGGDNGQWVYDRIMVISCPNVIPKERHDKTLIDKMYAERDGIIYKAVRALQTVIKNGYRFSEPESVTKARETYQSENSTVITFFEECMCPWPDSKINHHCTTGRIYRVYQAWCRENNNGFSRTAKEFREELAAHLGGTYQDITVRQKGNTYYREYGLSDETKELFVKEYGYDGNEFL
jgi:P4 family phage/plasmid primase-like protien